MAIEISRILIDRAIREMIEIGREINSKNKKVKLLVGDAFNLRIKKGFPDIIFFDGVLHHISDITRLLKRLKLVSHKNTVFIAREINLIFV